MRTSKFLDRFLDSADCCPWGATAGRQLALEATAPCGAPQARSILHAPPAPLYTAEQRRRRDASRWTQVQAVLAPVQFAVFLVSLAFVLRALATGSGAGLATGSIVVKTGVLYAIMVTGSIWEQRVFGRYLFAPAFFWEDVISLLVLALHTAYLAALAAGGMTLRQQLLLALAAYASYLINATQYVVKFRNARREQPGRNPAAGAFGSC
jgi:3-vinyl bacteriochlorophyllide hydratase